MQRSRVSLAGRAAALVALALPLAVLAHAAAGARAGGAFGNAATDAATSVPATITHRDHAAALYAAADTGAGAWFEAAARALVTGVVIEPPYVETGYLPAGSPDAFGYRITLRAGERLRLELTLDAAADAAAGAAPGGAPDAAPGAALFLDLFAVTAGGTPAGAEPLLAAAGPGVLEYEATADGAVVARLQPSLGDAARYTLAITRTAALVFPVAGVDASAVVGHFFDPRDGGARRHRGIDIHAPRGTPVLAAADGTIERVDHTPVGGRVIWLREARSDRTHYYAHLDSQLVEAGARVGAGQPIGTVGTTGNAAGTPPHLHFGVYRNGTGLNPLSFLESRTAVPATAGPRDPVGSATSADAAAADGLTARVPARTRVAGAALRRHSAGVGPVTALDRHVELVILAEAGRLLRVRHGGAGNAAGEGFLARWLVEPLPRVETAP